MGSVRQWYWRPGFNPRVSHTKVSKMVLDTTLLNTQLYKARIKNKVEQSREWSSAPLHLVVVVIEKGTFGSPSTTIANITFIYTYIYIYIYIYIYMSA